jgi:hypothetical protein
MLYDCLYLQYLQNNLIQFRVLYEWLSQYSVLLRAGRPGDRCSIPGRGEIVVNVAFMTRPALGPTQYPVGTGGPFPGDNARPRRDADHSPPSSAEFENE